MPDAPDPCQDAADLRRIRRELVTGQGVTETRFGDDWVKWGKPDLARLDVLIAEADKACALASGEPKRRRRYAMGAFARPY